MQWVKDLALSLLWLGPLLWHRFNTCTGINQKKKKKKKKEKKRKKEGKTRIQLAYT